MGLSKEHVGNDRNCHHYLSFALMHSLSYIYISAFAIILSNIIQ